MQKPLLNICTSNTFICEPCAYMRRVRMRARAYKYAHMCVGVPVAGVVVVVRVVGMVRPERAARVRDGGAAACVRVREPPQHLPDEVRALAWNTAPPYTVHHHSDHTIATTLIHLKFANEPYFNRTIFHYLKN